MSVTLPNTIEQAVSPEWLSLAISERHPGTRIVAVEDVAIVHAVAARAAIRVVYEGPGARHLPTRLFVKGGLAPDTAHLLAGGAYYREARFYREIAPRLAIGTPQCLYAGYGEESRQGVVILENLLAGGARLYRLGDTHSVAEARLFVDALARLHALSAPLLADGGCDWVPPTDAVVPRLIKNDPLRLLTDHLVGSRGDALPAAFRDPALILAALQALMGAASLGPDCLLHGDMHLGNIFRQPDGGPGWYDWQTLQRGCRAMDLVYYLVGSLAPADRVAEAPELLRRYVEALAAAGGPAVALEDARDLYRRYIAYGLFIWAVARESIVPLPALKRLLNRFARAAADEETFLALSI